MEEIVRQADIVIAAAGQAELIKGSWIKPGAAVIDVGTNPVPDPSKKAGFRLVGDCLYEECKEVAGAITPVPGGVGPMTIAMLLKNTVTQGGKVIRGEIISITKKENSAPSLSVVVLGTLVVGAVLQRVALKLLGGSRKK